jgi:four helix bundle protein
VQVLRTLCLTRAGQSKPDFRSKIAISRKEAFETRFWLRLMVHADARLTPSASPLLQESNELIAILTTIKKNSETNDNRG